MRPRLQKIVTTLIIVIVLCVAISVALLRVFVFPPAKKGHSSVFTDKVLVRLQAQPNGKCTAQLTANHRSSNRLLSDIGEASGLRASSGTEESSAARIQEPETTASSSRACSG